MFYELRNRGTSAMLERSSRQDLGIDRPTVRMGRRSALFFLAVGLTVGVAVSVAKITTAVVGGRIEGVDVDVGVTGGVRIKVDMSASRIRTPMMMGMAYLRSISGKVVTGATGNFPEYPSAVNRLLRLAA